MQNIIKVFSSHQKGFLTLFLVMKSNTVNFQVPLIYMCRKIQGIYRHSYTVLIMQNKETSEINVLFF